MAGVFDYLTGKAPEKQYPVGSVPKPLPNSSGQGWNDSEHKSYIGPDFPPQASPQGSYQGSQSVSPPKDNY